MLAKVHGSGTQSNSGPGPSPAIFGRMPTLNAIHDPNVALIVREEFSKWGPHNSTVSAAQTQGVHNHHLFISANGTIGDGGIKNASSIKFDAGANDNAAAVVANGAGLVTIKANSGRQVAFEVRVRRDTVANTKHGTFVGLTDVYTPTATAPIQANGTLADKNLIGFHIPEGAGSTVCCKFKASGQAEQNPANTTIAADTWTKLGFLFDGASTLKWFKDGQEIAAARLESANMTAATFPANQTLTPICGIVNATGTSPGATFLDRYEVGMTFTDGD